MSHSVEVPLVDPPRSSPDLPEELRALLTEALSRPAQQQPEWPDEQVTKDVCAVLEQAPPVTLPNEVDRLHQKLAAVARGEAFLLQGGDCTETFSGNTGTHLSGTINILLQMAVILTYSASMPIVKVGRIAGQYAKPYTTLTDSDGLSAYRGDMVNSFTASRDHRVPDPTRMLRAYANAGATLNLVRALTREGMAGLGDVREWSRASARATATGQRYEAFSSDIDRALAFINACGVTDRSLRMTEIFASHEALVLDYERAMLRATRQQQLYSAGAHFLWIGERTRQLDGAHIALAELVTNPIGVKLGPSTTPDQALEYVKRLDPHNEPGRVTLITRMGASRLRGMLGRIVEEVTASGHQVVWQCDPMAGNTYISPGGHKTRYFDDVLDEVRGFFEIHRSLGTHPGGVHIEFTERSISECLESDQQARVDEPLGLERTSTDPRLNARQSLELAFSVAEMLRDLRADAGSSVSVR